MTISTLCPTIDHSGESLALEFVKQTCSIREEELLARVVSQNSTRLPPASPCKLSIF